MVTKEELLMLNIRKLIGTYEDFVMTALITYKQTLQFS